MKIMSGIRDLPYLQFKETIELHRPCPPNEVWLKTWSENSGLEAWAKRNRIIMGDPTALANLYYGIQAPRYRLHTWILIQLTKENAA